MFHQAWAQIQTGAQFENDAYVKSGVSYNLKKAKTLLQEGYKETGIKSIKVTLLASDDDSSKQTAEFLQSQLDRLPNVNISVQNIPFTQLISRQTAGNYEITIKNWQAVLVIQLTSWMFSKKDQVISTTAGTTTNSINYLINLKMFTAMIL